MLLVLDRKRTSYLMNSTNSARGAPRRARNLHRFGGWTWCGGVGPGAAGRAAGPRAESPPCSCHQTTTSTQEQSCTDRNSSQFENNFFTEMCSGSEVGSYSRLTDLVHRSTLGVKVIKKKKNSPQEREFKNSLHRKVNFRTVWKPRTSISE